MEHSNRRGRLSIRRKFTPVQFLALVSAAYGIAALLAGIGILLVLLAHPDATIDTVLLRFHTPFSRFHPGILSDALSQVLGIRLWMLASFAFVYALMRFVETYGLWIEAVWGEIYTALSALIYVPFELESIWRSATWLNCASLCFNLLVVGYLLNKLREHHHRRRCRRSPSLSPRLRPPGD